MIRTFHRTHSLVDWRPRHVELEALLRDAARIAPEADEERFHAAWTVFTAALRLHKAQEERWLLPVFATLRAHAAPNQTSASVEHDHHLLDRYMAVVDGPVGDVVDRVTRAEALSRLLQILDHHDRREADGMLPLLDAHASREERATWIARIVEEEDALPSPAPPAPQEAGPGLICPSADPADRLAAAAAQDQDLGEALSALPALTGANGERVTRGLAAAVLRAQQAPTLVARRDALLDVLDALRRWRAVRGSQAGTGAP